MKHYTVWVSHGFNPDYGILKTYHTEELTQKEIESLGIACTLVEMFDTPAQAKHFCEEMNRIEVEERKQISKLFEKKDKK